MAKILIIAGTRPNFIKIGPIFKALSDIKEFDVKLCHTGQHFDPVMNDIFFKELNLPIPHYQLNINGGSHASQTARIMLAFEEVVLMENPNLVIVVGDVNSTMACSLVASKLNVKLAHVEAGLRSFDKTMPEEINRMVTDSIADFLFVSEPSGITHLTKEGHDMSTVFYVGNVMIDTLIANENAINTNSILTEYNLKKNDYLLLTLHRPSNVDDPKTLNELVMFINSLCERKTVIFPVHPRTRKQLETVLLNNAIPANLIFTEPLGYLPFQKLLKHASVVITDSGGIQEETTFIGIPCITLRENTERPITIDVGTNILVGNNYKEALLLTDKYLELKSLTHTIPELWDGKTSTRIAKILKDKLLIN